MASLATFEDLKDFSKYKTATRSDVDKLKVDQRVDLFIVFSFKFEDKKRPMILFGEPKADVKTKLNADAKKNKYGVKKGKVTLQDINGEKKLLLQGDVPAKQLASALAQVEAPYQEVIESTDAVDLTTKDSFDDDEKAPQPNAQPTAKVNPPQKKDEPTPDQKARSAATELKNKAKAMGASPVDPGKSFATPSEDIQESDFGTLPQDQKLKVTEKTAGKDKEKNVGAYDVGEPHVVDPADPKRKHNKSMSQVDVAKQQTEDVKSAVSDLVNVNNLCNKQLEVYRETTGVLTAVSTSVKELQKTLTEPDKLKEAEKLIKDSDKLAADILAEIMNLTEKMSDVKRKMEAFKKEKDPQKQYQILQPGSGQTIQDVYQQIEKVYAETNRRLVVLGRCADTLPWAAKAGEKEGQRVLGGKNWTRAVNDAFMKAGLDQKADFAMVTNYDPRIKSKLKEIIKNPDKKPIEELITQFREFVKGIEADDKFPADKRALWKGDMAKNDGWAVSMIELEQVIRDGYMMMDHDPTGSEFAGEGSGTNQVMVPKGHGEKLKAELEKGVAEKQARTVTKQDDQARSEREKMDGDLKEMLAEQDMKELLKNPTVKSLLAKFRKARDGFNNPELAKILETLKQELAKSKEKTNV